MTILSDIAALAKAGYKFSEVKELINTTKNVSDSNVDPETEVDDVPEVVDVPETKNETSKDIDYKSMYLEAKKELAELQNNNTKTEVEEVSYTIDDIVKSMSKSIE